MKIIEKFNEKSKNLAQTPPVTIAFLGDSVTQGCFDLYCAGPNIVQTDDFKGFLHRSGTFPHARHFCQKLRKIFNMLYPEVPVNIINAGISGGKAWEGAERLDRDVLRFSPDLCVVCFGLNDCCGTQEDDFERYQNAMKEIFAALQNANIEVIFLTPNMMCTNTSCHIENEAIKGIADAASQIQLSGKLEQFLSAAKDIAAGMDIPVCDCYAKWKLLYECGVNITELLSNRINHPTPEMNWLFAGTLVETMFH